MSLFCIVWSKNSHRTCISVCTSALSEQFCRVCAEARYEGFEHTHAHMHTHKISFWNTYTCKHTVHLSFPSSNTHTPTNIHTQTDWYSPLWSYILFALPGCAGWLASLWMHLHGYSMCIQACISVCVCRGSISVHKWSPKSSLCRICLHVYMSGV